LNFKEFDRLDEKIASAERLLKVGTASHLHGKGIAGSRHEHPGTNPLKYHTNQKARIVHGE
jgi:hypothetical protein